MSLSTSTMLVELDTLLDTRLGALLDINSELVPELLASGQYNTRVKDEFRGFDTQVFLQRYKERDQKVLKNAMATPMLAMLHDFVMKTLSQTLRTPFHQSPKIEVNFYPYQLDQDTTSEILRCVAAVTKGMCDIEAVHLSAAQLNPLFIREKYSVVAMYDYHDWMKMHFENGMFAKYTCPGTTIFAPMMIKNPATPTGGGVYDSIVDDMEKISDELRPFFQLFHLPVNFFSWTFDPRVELDKRAKQEDAGA